jgi:hypothetical protein
VDERCIAGVEVELEGERWVTDIMYEEQDEESVLSMSPKSAKGPKGKGAVKGKGNEKSRIVTWEEGQGRHKLGEWRRRRWIRFVERVVVNASKDDGTVVANE